MKHILSPLTHIPNRAQRIHSDSHIITQNKSYVSRANRITDTQKKFYTEAMEKYGLPPSKESHISLIPLETDYSLSVLDIGFGMGETLFDMAVKNPQHLFIGIETYKTGVGALCVRIVRENINNIYIHHGDAVEFLFNQVEDNSMDRIQIFFPDPWPKTRHHKRRLIQIRFLQLCTQIVKPNGIVWIVTDWQPYAKHIQDTAEEFNSLDEHYPRITLQSPSELHAQLEETRNITRFEQKGIKKGHSIYSFVWQVEKSL